MRFILLVLTIFSSLAFAMDPVKRCERALTRGSSTVSPELAQEACPQENSLRFLECVRTLNPKVLTSGEGAIEYCMKNHSYLFHECAINLYSAIPVLGAEAAFECHKNPWLKFAPCLNEERFQKLKTPTKELYQCLDNHPRWSYR